MHPEIFVNLLMRSLTKKGQGICFPALPDDFFLPDGRQLT